MKLIKTGLRSWSNQHQTFVESINDLYHLGNDTVSSPLEEYNATTKGIQKILNDAIVAEESLRALGAGWSWTKIATVNGIMLNTQPLNSIFTISQASVLPAYPGQTSKLFFAQCGNAVWEINNYLKKKNLSLKTSGASNGQTIVGVMSTGGHGSAFNFGAIPEYIVGLHIILSPTRHIWLERNSYPVASPALVQNFRAELVRDDELFNAALVSFGSCGFIHGVMFEVEDIYLLECYRQRIKYDDALIQVMQTLNFSNANFPPYGNEVPFHFSLILNQYDLENGAYVNTMYKRPYRTDYKPPVSDPDKAGPGDDASALLGKITNLMPGLTPTLLNKFIKTVYPISPTNEPEFGTAGEIFSNTDIRGKVLSAAIGIPLSEIKKVIQLLIDENNKRPFAGVFAFRFVKKSTATLGFTKFDPTCVVELDGPHSNETLKFYSELWQQLDVQQIPYTFHWGKVNELNPVRIQKMYGQSLDAWKDARNKLLDPDMIRVFTNPLMKEWGL